MGGRDEVVVEKTESDDGELRAWNDAIEAAAQFMESRKISASQFYATELRKMKKK